MRRAVRRRAVQRCGGNSFPHLPRQPIGLRVRNPGDKQQHQDAFVSSGLHIVTSATDCQRIKTSRCVAMRSEALRSEAERCGGKLTKETLR